MKYTPETGKDFADYYLHQIGHGMPVYAGSTMQRGHGIGNILKGLFRVASPLIKSVGKQALKKSVPVLKEVGKHALKRGLNALDTEMRKPKRPKIVQTMGEVLHEVATESKPTPIRRQQKKRTPNRRRPQKKPQDIFSL